MDGIIVVNKPIDMTSSRAVQLICRLFPGQKAGHTGTLDPLATGVLPVCLGRATRLAEYVVQLPKTYRAEITLGKTSDTGDAEGRISETGAVPSLEHGRIEEVLLKFKGEIEQLPPFYSAVKHEGKPLYHWTRKGREVPRRLRTATIFEINLLQLNFEQEPHLVIEVRCSSGTYIRTLAADIGEEIGCGAYLSALVRTAVGPYRLDNALTPEQAAEMAELGRAGEIVLPMDTAVQHLRRISLKDEQLEALRNGLILKPDDRSLLRDIEESAPVRVYDGQGNFKALVSKIDQGGEPGLKTLKYIMQER